MAGKSWNEEEIGGAVRGYFELLGAQEKQETLIKSAIYQRLSAQFPQRSAKAFERKFQNISAILYEERLPFVDGLLPNSNYQRLLKLIVLDHLDRTKRPDYLGKDILVEKLKSICRRGDIRVDGAGSGRYGLAVEKALGIPPNSDKKADFMGVEIKTKIDNSLQTLFSRAPSRYHIPDGKSGLIREYGYTDSKKDRRALFTSFNSSPDTLGFSLSVAGDEIAVKNDQRLILTYDCELLEAALLSKHSETMYLKLSKTNNGQSCIIESALYGKWPSIIRFKKLIEKGYVNLDFMLSEKSGKIRDRGFLWRCNPNALQELYLETEVLGLQ